MGIAYQQKRPLDKVKNNTQNIEFGGEIWGD